MVLRPLALAPVGLAAAFVLLELTASTAHAYCRTHTKDPRQSTCPEVCTKAGLPLYWSKPDLTYMFNQRGFPGLADADLRRMIATSFDTWAKVRCGGESVGLSFTAKPGTTTLEVGPDEGPNREPNDNVIVHLDGQSWRAQGLSPNAFAITSVWFNEVNGEILGADIQFNGLMDSYGECQPERCEVGDPRTDLRNVATHEIGHFLGLSHSDVPDSTMSCAAERDETEKRSLSSDDTAGLCDIYPPQDTLWSYSGADSDDGCTAGPSGRASRSMGGGLGLVLLSFFGLALRRRRR